MYHSVHSELHSETLCNHNTSMTLSSQRRINLPAVVGHEESRSFICETWCLCVLVATFIKLKVLFLPRSNYITTEMKSNSSIFQISY